jgi:hypothetical protein
VLLTSARRDRDFAIFSMAPRANVRGTTRDGDIASLRRARRHRAAPQRARAAGNN